MMWGVQTGSELQDRSGFRLSSPPEASAQEELLLWRSSSLLQRPKVTEPLLAVEEKFQKSCLSISLKLSNTSSVFTL